LGVHSCRSEVIRGVRSMGIRLVSVIVYQRIQCTGRVMEMDGTDGMDGTTAKGVGGRA
jgi:hypothetical protein